MAVKAIATTLILAGATNSPSLAQGSDPSRELWAGAYASTETWFIFSGGTTAPFGDLNHDGFRLRAVAGRGSYEFSGRQRIERSGFSSLRPLVFTDSVTFSDALAGYMIQLGSLTAKGFAGVAFVDHDISGPRDFNPSLRGTEWGPKAQIELWYDPGGPYWAALNAGYTTAHDAYSLSARAGFRLGDSGFSIGSETTLDNKATAGAGLTGAYARTGGFVRYAWELGEISVSGGVIIDLDDSADLVIEDPISAYGGLSILTKF